MTLQRNKASFEDIDLVKSILEKAATIPASKGIDQWPKSFNRSSIEGYIARDSVYLYSLNNNYVGTVDLRNHDPNTWPGDNTRSLYIHRLAVDPAFSGRGIGGMMLKDIKSHAISSGYGYIRLDCVTHNEKLRKYYEKAGFTHLRDVPMADILTSLYQLKIS